MCLSGTSGCFLSSSVFTKYVSSLSLKYWIAGTKRIIRSLEIGTYPRNASVDRVLQALLHARVLTIIDIVLNRKVKEPLIWDAGHVHHFSFIAVFLCPFLIVAIAARIENRYCSLNTFCNSNRLNATCSLLHRRYFYVYALSILGYIFFW